MSFGSHKYKAGIYTEFTTIIIENRKFSVRTNKRSSNNLIRYIFYM
jgi:hypothetical protein